MEIEKNVPVKDDNMKKKKYPFKEMIVGDSLFIECTEDQRDRTKKMLVSASFQFSRKNKDFRFKISRVDDGVRIWRVEWKKPN